MSEQEPRELVEQRGPFQVIEREIRHDKFGMRLIADRVLKPDGTPGEQYWIEFPRQAVLIFPFDDEGNIYLTEEFTYATNKYSVEVAGGGIDEGENPEEAARREVKEELGIEAESMDYLGTLHDITSRINNASHLFLAKVRSVGEAKPESGEVIRLKKVPFEKAFQMTLNGEITTSSVVAGILKIKLLLEAQK